MKLVSDIINELMESSIPLSSVLLKAKVLASRIDNKLLLDWVNHELNGYPNEDILPEYRKNFGSYIKGDYMVGSMKYTNQPIPTSGLTFNIISKNFKDSVSSLEQTIKNAESQTLIQPLPAEIVGLLEANWQSYGSRNEYIQLINARKVIAVTAFSDILTQVRSRLLDFMLEVDKAYGNLTELKDLNKENNKISQIMNQTIINANGDGNVVTTGNYNDINSTIKINKSNKDQLSEVLKANKVDSEEIFELLEVIDSDNHNLQNKTFGDKTNNWFQKMIAKSLNGSWQVTVGAAGNILASALQMYLGF